LFTELMTNVYANLFSALTVVMPTSFSARMPLGADKMTVTRTGVGLKMIGAGIAGIGMFGAGLGQGLTGQGACMAIGRNPEVASKITSTMIIGAGIAESGAIYALVIAILIIFVA
jgi:F-type H+-transporting ATPase subunit c